MYVGETIRQLENDAEQDSLCLLNLALCESMNEPPMGGELCFLALPFR